jgi:ASC-1-like (ASCH) protein
MVHNLKTLPKYFIEVKLGKKPFEVRRNDRNFKVGDTLILQENDPETGYTGRQLTCIVTYILDELEYVREGYVVLGIFVKGFNRRAVS